MNNFQVGNPGFHSKMKFYSPIGDGRDTYISFNNGGIWKRKTYTDPIESAQYFRSPKYFSKKPNIPAKNVHYPPDGSGRDVFIKFDEGGVLPITPTTLQSRNYITSLRSYCKSSLGARPDIPDFFKQSQHTPSWKDYVKESRISRSQKRLTERLILVQKHKIPFIKEKKEKRDALLPKLKP